MSVTRREEVTVASLRPPLGHYAQAVRFGNLLFVTGCTGVTADGQLVADDVVEQTRHVFRNLQAILAAAGATFSDVLKVTTYLTDVRDAPLINPVRQEVFGQTRPASTLVQISALPCRAPKSRSTSSPGWHRIDISRSFPPALAAASSRIRCSNLPLRP